MRIEQEAILDWLTEVRSATLREIAEHFGCSQQSARMKADGLVAQGKLDLKRGTHAEGGRPMTQRRYSVPRPDAFRWIELDGPPPNHPQANGARK